MIHIHAAAVINAAAVSGICTIEEVEDINQAGLVIGIKEGSPVSGEGFVAAEAVIDDIDASAVADIHGAPIILGVITGIRTPYFQKRIVGVKKGNAAAPRIGAGYIAG